MKTWSGIEKNVTKDKLVEMVENKKYVKLSIVCLKIQKTDIFKEIVFHLRKNEIVSIVSLLDKQTLDFLIGFLIENMSGECIEEFILWFKYILSIRSNELKNSDI